MKLKLITASLVLATSGSAHALIIDGTFPAGGKRGDGELFMTLLNETKQISYILDLNVRMYAFLDGVANGQTYVYAADANMLSFLATSAGDPLLWAIGASDNSGANAKDWQAYISTASSIDLANTLRNQDLAKMGTSADIMLANVNADIGNNASLIITDPNRSAYAGYAQWYHNWGGAANFIADGPIGQPMNLYHLRQTTGLFADRNKPSMYLPLTYNGQPYQATLDMGGNLTITPVPEPETYALMLAGLGLVGWMARRRKSA
ncbi:MAG: FxDxF family PEP-CTERM protein [Thiobacillaceae bacterium]